jgi:23S rRNA (uracil1939-C5)-methyltransferase
MSKRRSEPRTAAAVAAAPVVLRLRIDRLGHLGDGIGTTATGERVHAPRILPDEEVEGAVAAGRMAAPRILTPVPERVRAPCPHYAACGGCALQHAQDAFVSNWKQEVVRAALAAQGIVAPFRPLQVSPASARRRAVLAGRRLRAGALVGFHSPAAAQLVAVPDCRLLHPALMAALPALEALVALGGARKGEMALTLTRTETGLDLSVRDAPAADGAQAAALGAEAARRGLARLSWNGEVLAQQAVPRVRFGRAEVPLPPGAFLQATAEGEAALLAAVRAAVGPARRIADLFAGCGTFALPLAEAAEVHAVEGEAAMLEALEAGWRSAPGLRRVATEARDLFRRPLAGPELARFDAVVIDPPRAGAAAQVAALAAAPVPVIAAVSCNPVTFARDARVLVQAGYRLDWVQVVDQFRWSAHVELAARLSHPHMAR